jgi:hypothetical protein
MQIALYARHQLIKSKPLMEFPRSWRALMVLFVLEVTTSSSPMDARSWLQDHMRQSLAEIAMDFEPTVPSTDPPQPFQLQEEAGPSNSPEFLPQVFTGTPISQPTPLGLVSTPEGHLTRQTLAMDTLASGAGTPPSPCFFPPRAKLPKKKALPKCSDLSIFNILNIFHHHWFLSVDSLRAQALLA